MHWIVLSEQIQQKSVDVIEALQRFNVLVVDELQQSLKKFSSCSTSWLNLAYMNTFHAYKQAEKK